MESRENGFTDALASAGRYREPHFVAVRRFADATSHICATFFVAWARKRQILSNLQETESRGVGRHQTQRTLEKLGGRATLTETNNCGSYEMNNCLSGTFS
jgi:hypothetical protein